MFEHPDLVRLDREVRRIRRVASAMSVLSWDQETHMPDGGAGVRAEVLGDLAEVAHRMATSDAYGDLIAAAEAALPQEGQEPERAAAYLSEVRRRYDRRRRVPPELAEELARTASQAQRAWKEARRSNDFPLFQPWLEKLVVLKTREAEARDPDGPVYDTLLDDYERDCTAATVQRLVDAVKPVLIELTGVWGPRTSGVAAEFLRGYAVADQVAFCRAVVAELGFDLERGRIDVSTHPFCSGFNPGDVRLTTRYADELPVALFGLIHECGHGLYEQGLDPAWYGTPLGEAVSMGIHESQSRLWENMIGRSPEFWSHSLPKLRAAFPGKVDGVERADFVRAINTVRPSPIRVEADEVTYNLHIMVRFEVERELFADGLDVSELPALWNRRMEEYLGLTPSSDTEGILQDIHWSFGGFGYFPTYFLGNLYAAQLHAAAAAALPDLDRSIAAGEFGALLEWLREHVHRPGGLYPAPELCRRASGEPLSPEPFCRYLQGKMEAIHGA